MLFQQLSTYLLEILIRIIVGTCFLWTDIYTKKYLRITVIRPIGVTPSVTIFSYVDQFWATNLIWNKPQFQSYLSLAQFSPSLSYSIINIFDHRPKIIGYLYNIWTIFGQYLGNIWAIFGQYLGDIWAIFGQYLGNIWAIFGQHVNNIRSVFIQLSDNIQSIFWTISR